MMLKVSSIIAAVLLFVISYCHNSAEAQIVRTSWLYSYPRAASEARMGRQMPPHHEPDAVLINVSGGNGQAGIPGGGVPGRPGIFGTPGGPGVFGVPEGPSVFGVPGGAIPNPGVFGFPNGFGFPGSPGNPHGPVFFPQGQNNPVLPNGPGVFSPRGQGNPTQPNEPGAFPPYGQSNPAQPNEPGAFPFYGQGNPAQPNGPGVQFGQNGPGVFGMPNGPSRPREPTGFGLPGVFAVAGSGNIPGVPGFFVPGRSPYLPQTPNNLPGQGSFVPESFVPGGMNGFQPGGMVPGAFFPEAPFVPNQQEGPGSFGGSFPGIGVNGETDGREVYDEPEASFFPMVKKNTFSFGSS